MKLERRDSVIGLLPTSYFSGSHLGLVSARGLNDLRDTLRDTPSRERREQSRTGMEDLETEKKARTSMDFKARYGKPCRVNLCEVAQDPGVSYLLRSSYDGFVKGSSVLVSG